MDVYLSFYTMKRKKIYLSFDHNKLCFVIALQQFEGSKTDATHMINFLGIQTSKSFIRKKLHKIEKCLKIN